MDPSSLSPFPAFPLVVVQVPIHGPFLERGLSAGFSLGLLFPFSFETSDVRFRLAVFCERNVRLCNPMIRLLRHVLECNLRVLPSASSLFFRRGGARGVLL
jgi:hypothetical protein